MYILYDEWHKFNSTKSFELLRHVSLISNLQLLNTQASEQLNSRIGRDNYFLDRMCVVNHVFYLRLVIELQNELRNRESFFKLKKSCAGPGKVVKFDKYRRLYIGTSVSDD